MLRKAMGVPTGGWFQTNTYFQPDGSNFENVDSLVVNKHGVFIFQVTIAVSHPGSAKGVGTVCEKLCWGCKKQAPVIVFVIEGDYSLSGGA